MSNYQYGVNCIVAKVKSEEELDLKFVLNRKQYTVTYKERKEHNGGRNLSKLLSESDALKASIWNVPSGPPGSKTRSWFVTDIWNPNIAGLEKLRLPEPTISIVCRISHLLAKDFFVCVVGKHFTKDIIVLHRDIVHSVAKNTCPKIGDYLLVFSLIFWEIVDGSKICRLIPLWAHWDISNCTVASTAHLNIVERGPENSTLLIPDQIPCMWGVVQNVHKKTLRVYVPCISSSVTVPYTSIYHYDQEILKEDWIQLWLTPKVTDSDDYHFSVVSSWTCSNCCWFGQAKRRYEAYLKQRLNVHYVKHTSPPVLGSAVPPARASSIASTTAPKSKVPKPTQQPPSKPDSDAGQSELGVGKVCEVREKSGMLRCQTEGCQKDHTFHMGLLTIFGVKMATIKVAKMMDLVEKGSELHYRMNPLNHQLRAIWIGPEYVTFKHLNFMPKLREWIIERDLKINVVEEMMKEIMDKYETATQGELEKKAKAQMSAAEAPKRGMEGLAGGSVAGNGVAVVGGATAMGRVPQRGSGDGQDNKDDVFEDSKYSKEEEEELEKLWWSDDSEELEDELTPVLPPNGALLPARDDGDEVAVEEAGESSVDLIVLDEVCASPWEQGGQSNVVGATGRPELMPEAEQGGAEAKHTQLEKGKKKASVLMLVLFELTRFLMEKGKSETVADASEVSADFVAQLEKALEGANGNDLLAPPTPLMKSIGLQTDMSGPVPPVRPDEFSTSASSLT